MSTITVCDAIHDNIGQLPAGATAGYTTGTPNIKWSPDDFAAHPAAVRICQDAGATDTTADVLDVETGAATPAECAVWYREALANFRAAKRPGQRYPAIYASVSNLPAIANALIAAGVTAGPRLWVAHWGITADIASGIVAAAGGPFPVIGFQYDNNGPYDTSVFDVSWHSTGSEVIAPYFDHSGWVKLDEIPASSAVFFNAAAGTVGYHDTSGQWIRVHLP